MNAHASPAIEFHDDASLGALLGALEPHAGKSLVLAYAGRITVTRPTFSTSLSCVANKVAVDSHCLSQQTMKCGRSRSNRGRALWFAVWPIDRAKRRLRLRDRVARFRIRRNGA